MRPVCVSRTARSTSLYLRVPDWRSAVTEVRRVLRPGGILLWYDLTFPPLLVSVLRPLVRNFGLYTAAEVKAAFESAGMAVEGMECAGRGPFAHYDVVARKQSE